MAQPAFNIFDVLSAWGKTLPGWQHFLLSKLVVTVELTDETLDEVFAEYLIDLNWSPNCGHHDWHEALSMVGRFGRLRRTGTGRRWETRYSPQVL